MVRLIHDDLPSTKWLLRETAMYIREHDEYIVDLDIGEPKLRKSIKNCKSASVRQEIESMLYNIPDLFVD